MLRPCVYSDNIFEVFMAPRNTPKATPLPTESTPIATQSTPIATETQPSATESALQAQVAALQAQLALASITSMQAPRADTGKLFVGIRSISNNTLGLPKSPTQNEPDVTLHAVSAIPDPNNVAIVSYPFWQQLRKHRYFDEGMFVRDDSVLGSTEQAAPEDDPRDLAPNHTLNAIIDPFDWIANKSEAELKAAVARLTSEAALRRLLWAVQQEVNHFFNALPADDEERITKAENSISAKMQYVQNLADMRLLALTSVYRRDEV